MEDETNTARLIEHVLSIADNNAIAPDFCVGRLLTRASDVGVWRLSLPECAIHPSPRTRELLGQDDGMPIPLADLLGLIPTDQRMQIAGMIVQAITEKKGFRFTSPITDFKGRDKIVECIGDVSLSAENEVTAMIGSLRDLTGSLHAKRLATGRMLIIKALMKNIPLAIAILDTDMKYVAVSDYWASGHGHETTDEFVGKLHYKLFDIPDEMKREHRQVLNGITLIRPRDFLTDAKGDPIMQDCTMAPWYEAPGKVGGMVIVLSQVDRTNTVPSSNEVLDGPTEGEFDSLLSEIA